MLLFSGEVMVVLVMWWYPGSLEQHQGDPVFCFSWGELLPVADFHLIVLPDLVHCGWPSDQCISFSLLLRPISLDCPGRLWVKYLRSIKGNLFLTATTRFIRETLTWHISPKSSSSDQLSSALVHFLSVQHICGFITR